MLYKGAIIRIYPNPEQERGLNRMIGCYRFVYNWLLAFRVMLWVGGKVSMSEFGSFAWIPFIQARYPWLDCLTVDMIRRSFSQVERAYQNFFSGRTKKPKFKAKHKTKRAFSYTGCLQGSDGTIKISGIGEVKAKWHVIIPTQDIVSVTIEHRPSGKWIASVCYGYKPIEAPTPKHRMVGVDKGISVLAMPSHGNPLKNPRGLQHNLRTLKLLQRGLTRKARGSKSYAHWKQRIAKVHERITSGHKYAVNKWVHHLASENQAVRMEDLNVAGMLQNHKLAQALADARLGYIRVRLEQKFTEMGREVLYANRWFPSTKLCRCGHKQDLSLSDRKWTCERCGRVHNRDRNAAWNLEHYDEMLAFWPVEGQPRQGMPGTQVELPSDGHSTGCADMAITKPEAGVSHNQPGRPCNKPPLSVQVIS